MIIHHFMMMVSMRNILKYVEPLVIEFYQSVELNQLSFLLVPKTITDSENVCNVQLNLIWLTQTLF